MQMWAQLKTKTQNAIRIQFVYGPIFVLAVRTIFTPIFFYTCQWREYLQIYKMMLIVDDIWIWVGEFWFKRI